MEGPEGIEETITQEDHSAYQYVNQAYQKEKDSLASQAMTSSEIRNHAQSAAEDAGGDSLDNYSRTLADNSIEPLISKTDYNPVSIYQTEAQIGLTQDNSENIIKERYGSRGEYQIENLTTKFELMKDLFSETMFEPSENQETVDSMVNNYLERGVLTPQEADLFTETRKNLIEQKENALIESSFLSIKTNPEKADYIRRQVSENKLKPDVALSIVSRYNLTSAAGI